MAAVTSMSSAYEQRKVLAALAAAPALPEPVALDGVKAAGDISSAHDKRQALTAYVARSARRRRWLPRRWRRRRQSARRTTRREVLLEVVAKGGVTDETAPAFFAAATTIGSSHDLGRVLRAVAARPRLPGGDADQR